MSLLFLAVLVTPFFMSWAVVRNKWQALAVLALPLLGLGLSVVGLGGLYFRPADHQRECGTALLGPFLGLGLSLLFILCWGFGAILGIRRASRAAPEEGTGLTAFPD